MPRIDLYIKKFYEKYYNKLFEMEDVDTSRATLVARAVKAFVDKPDLPRLRNHLIEHPEDITRYERMLKELKLKYRSMNAQNAD